MLQIERLVKIYPGPVAALQGIDLTIGTGMFGLLGPNGAGKSTLMKVLAGLLEPTSGHVWLDGVDVTSEPRKIWSRLGYLPQDFGFYPHLTGRDMLLHLLKLKRVQAKGGLRKLTDELLERVNLTQAARRKVSSYSGGMRQRLGIAQALAGNPRLIIVDEPTAGLDPEERLRFYHLLAELAEERIVLLSTHIVDDVAVLCPEFAVIREGQLVARTTPGAAVEAMQGKVFELQLDAAEAVPEWGDVCILRSLLMQSQKRVRAFSEDGRAPEGFEVVEPTLEDAYLALMKADGVQLPPPEVPLEPASEETLTP